MLALARPGDEIILPSPWYFNHSMTLDQLGLTLVPLRCLPPNFLPSVEECERLITPRTKALVLVSPNNPTGAVYPPDLLKQFAELAEEKKVALVLDETYRDFLEERPHDLFAETNWRRYLIHLFSFSKYARATPSSGRRELTAMPTDPTPFPVTDWVQSSPPSLSSLRSTSSWIASRLVRHDRRSEQLSGLSKQHDLGEKRRGTSWRSGNGCSRA